MNAVQLIIDTRSRRRHRRMRGGLPIRRHGRPRCGVALLTCIFVVSVVAVMVVSMLEIEMLHLAAERNSADYERALYLAGAAVHHALAELEDDPDWRDGVATTEFPSGSGNTYAATVVAGAGNTLVVTGTGTAGVVTRKLQATVDPGN